MLCELCGKNEGTLQVLVEGSSLAACNKCKNFGTVVGVLTSAAKAPSKQTVNKPTVEEPTEFLVRDYSKRIKSAREKLGKTQEEFAQLLREKASMVSKIETGQFEPTIETAKKLERILKIKLIETTGVEVQEIHKQQKTEGFTIGDFIKVKDRVKT